MRSGIASSLRALTFALELFVIVIVGFAATGVPEAVFLRPCSAAALRAISVDCGGSRRSSASLRVVFGADWSAGSFEDLRLAMLSIPNVEFYYGPVLTTKIRGEEPRGTSQACRSAPPQSAK